MTQRKYALELLECAILKLCSRDGYLLRDPSTYLQNISWQTTLSGHHKTKLIICSQALSQLCLSPRSSHFDSLTRVLRYIKLCAGQGQFFPAKNNLHLTTYCDSDWASCATTRGSVLGYVIFLRHSIYDPYTLPTCIGDVDTTNVAMPNTPATPVQVNSPSLTQVQRLQRIAACLVQYELQKAIDQDPSDNALRDEEGAYVRAFIEAKIDEELFLRQKAKIQWLEVARVILESLDEFKLVSGLVPIISLFLLGVMWNQLEFFCNVLNHVKIAILNIMPFSEGKLPLKYLGFPLISSRLLNKDCKVLVEKAHNRIGDWKNKSLSFAGRLQLYLVLNGAWNWPHAWLLKAPDLGLLPAPSLDGSRQDCTRWRDRNGNLTEFSVKSAWGAIRPR
ncbi:hypothetical protein Tco_0849029, partial [Tanacetum coccineum]